jgi:hypothetical protein
MSRLAALCLLVVLSLVLVNVANARGLLASTTIEGRITAVNVANDTPVLSVTTDKGLGNLLRAPEDSTVSPTMKGSRIRATGTLTDGVFLATSVERLPARQNVRASVAM